MVYFANTTHFDTTINEEDANVNDLSEHQQLDTTSTSCALPTTPSEAVLVVAATPIHASISNLISADIQAYKNPIYTSASTSFNQLGSTNNNNNNNNIDQFNNNKDSSELNNKRKDLFF